MYFKSQRQNINQKKTKKQPHKTNAINEFAVLYVEEKQIADAQNENMKFCHKMVTEYSN